MIWLAVIGLAASVFAALVVIGRLPRPVWIVALACLSAGLAGYASQASPDLPAAPAKGAVQETEADWKLIELRQQLIGEGRLSPNKLVITADAMTRMGDYQAAADFLGQVVHDDPDDQDAWLALANALVAHADGRLTPAAASAYRQAAATDPDGAGVAFFIGMALIRQGEVVQAREVWASRLATMPADGPGRQVLEERLADLDQLLVRLGKISEASNGK